MTRSDRILIATAGGALTMLVAAGWVLLSPGTAGAPQPSAAAGLILTSAAPSASTVAPADADGGSIVVDVEGAVAQPGVRELPAGSRIADAIAAAGGYAADADLAAAAASINLAQPLADGEQVNVPRIGDVATGPGPSAGPVAGGSEGGPSTSGMVNLNTATPEQLEALPGIGAVTVQKIVAARQERPFASLEEAVERGVIHRGQLEDIQGMATAG